ncbi:unnamed protein product [Tilletia controversa]|uniref:SET domain-containing protein n=3 Tax=Tilletia TaxID=13289 RepID=A0A8X7SYG1_9BASI|nr:hypothetical protein CF335_g5388 [Tilletia laevis]KAE8202315.1 hypothetical protein CF328_g2282 [Tilletia controversa]KAE8264058.1 hypothetical protein A4X03_0g1227 [Tilletia caries]KAE8198436.1 hypothetical protein CF336_g1685 [Tilletia laevis]KAE8250105.1 hypothetical protein A4X06_0g2921 [Tilletia controversa]
MRNRGGATARQARLAAARQEEEYRRAVARRRKASSSRSQQYYTDPLISDPFLPHPPEGTYVEAGDDGIDPDIDVALNTDVRALRKKPKLAFDRFEIRSLSAARMDAVRLPDIAQAGRNMAVSEALRRARMKRSAKLLEGTTFLPRDSVREIVGTRIQTLTAGASQSQASGSGTSGGYGAAGSASGSGDPGTSQEAAIWKSKSIAAAIAHHRTLWLAWVMEHENGTADITVCNEIDNEPSPPWDWCFTNQYMTNNLAPDEAADPPLQGCSCEDECDPATCECFAQLKLIDPITWSTETDFAYNRHGRLRNGHFEQCVILECNDTCGCSDSCRNRLVQHGRTVPLEVFKTAHCGWGVRAKTLIRKNEFIAAYAGELIDTAGMHERGKRYSKTATTYQLDIDSFHIRCLTRIGPFNEWRLQQGLEPMDPALEETYAAADDWWAIHDPDHVDPILTVDAGLWGNLTRFFNHSCDPNIDMYPVYTSSQDIMRPYLAFFARRDIPAGQELRFNYNGDLVEEVSVRPVPDAMTPTGANQPGTTQSGKTNGRGKANESSSARGREGGAGRGARGWEDEDEDEDEDDDGNTGQRSRQKAVAKERRRQTLLMQQDTASKHKKKQNQDRLLAGMDTSRSPERGGGGGQEQSMPESSSAMNEAAAAAAVAVAERDGYGGTSSSSNGPSSSSTAARSLGAMMAEIVPSGSREVELVDGVKAMVCRCGAPNCKGQVFT